MTFDRDLTKDVVRRLRRAGFDPPAGLPRFIGDGCDFRAWRIGDRVYRIAKHDGAVEALVREAALGRAIAPRLPCAISFVERLSEDDGIAEYAYFDHRPALRAKAGDALAADLAAFFDALHGLDASTLDVDALDAPIAAWQEVVHDELDAIGAEAWVRAALESPPDDGGARVLTHSDLAPEHVLVDDDGRLLAVIDWSDARISDPAIDLAGAWFWGDAAFAARVHARYRGPRDPELELRSRYLALCAAVHYAYLGDIDRREGRLLAARRTLSALRDAGSF